jgi:hypothetical protein
MVSCAADGRELCRLPVRRRCSLLDCLSMLGTRPQIQADFSGPAQWEIAVPRMPVVAFSQKRAPDVTVACNCQQLPRDSLLFMTMLHLRIVQHCCRQSDPEEGGRKLLFLLRLLRNVCAAGYPAAASMASTHITTQLPPLARKVVTYTEAHPTDERKPPPSTARHSVETSPLCHACARACQ